MIWFIYSLNTEHFLKRIITQQKRRRKQKMSHGRVIKLLKYVLYISFEEKNTNSLNFNEYLVLWIKLVMVEMKK